MNTIEIPLSKTKIFFGFAGSVLFIVLGVYLITTVAPGQDQLNPTIIKAIGLAAIVFFGATGILSVKKYFEKTIGLIIDNKGITDHSNASSIGFIAWSDISAIKTAQVMSTKFLLIYTKDPHKILDSISGAKKKILHLNMNMYGTPFSITSTTLKYPFNELEATLQQYLSTYGTP